MTMTLFHSLWTIVVLATFIGIILWAYSGKRSADFDAAAQLPFEDKPAESNNKTNRESPHG